MRRKRVDTDLELLIFPFFVEVLNHACSRSPSSPLRLWVLTIVFISSRLAVNWSLFLFPIPHLLPKRCFRLSSFQPIRAPCQFIADTFLFLTWAPTAMMIWISEIYLSLSHLFLLIYIEEATALTHWRK